MGVRSSIVRATRELCEPRGSSARADALRARLWDGWSLVRSARLRGEEEGRAAAAAPTPAAAVTPARLRAHWLTEVMPFWRAHGVDARFGGFHGQLDRRGVRTGDEKLASTQGRLLHTFATAHAETGDPEDGRIAARGFRFLRDHFWDARHGGWHRTTRRDGAVADASKHLCEQNYVLIGLAAWHRASGDPEALAWIDRTHEVLDARGRDRTHGGWVERCGPAWEPACDDKRLSVHLDLLMACLMRHGVDGGEAARVDTLAELLVARFAARRRGVLLETFSRDWRYRPGATGDAVYVGHLLKAAWVLLEVDRARGTDAHRATALALLDGALASAWDARHGGFFNLVSRSGRRLERRKLCWVQCEGLLALELAHRVTGDPRHGECARATAAFCLGHMADRVHGEWFMECRADGAVADDRKACPGKAGYHVTRACTYPARYEAETAGRPEPVAPGAASRAAPAAGPAS